MKFSFNSRVFTKVKSRSAHMKIHRVVEGEKKTPAKVPPSEDNTIYSTDPNR